MIRINAHLGFTHKLDDSVRGSEFYASCVIHGNYVFTRYYMCQSVQSVIDETIKYVIESNLYRGYREVINMKIRLTVIIRMDQEFLAVTCNAKWEDFIKKSLLGFVVVGERPWAKDGPRGFRQDI